MACRNKTLVLLIVVSLTLILFSLPAAAGTLQKGLDFTGTTRPQSGFIPPDTMGAVGPNHIVELLNGRYAVYDKTNGNPLAGISLNQFWTNANVNPAGAFAFDPRILYDPYSQRYFAAAVDNAGGANNFLVAVSNSSNPLTGWVGKSFASDPNGLRWADFPTLGLNKEGVYLSANMFPIVQGNTNVNIAALDKAALIGGNLAVTLFPNINPNTTGFSVQPAVDMDNRNNPAALLSSFNTPNGIAKRSDITGPINAPVLNTGTGFPDKFIATTIYAGPPDAAQPNGALTRIDTGDTRFGSNVVANDGLLWAVQSVEVDGKSAVRWLKINEATNAVLQEGVITDRSLAYYYPSIAVNDHGCVVIGFSGSDSQTYASAYAVLGETTGGVTTFDTPLLLKAGEGDYQRLDGIGRNRWGDYSATVLDPDDPYTFWTFQEYATTDNNWAIRITELSCSPVPLPSTLLFLTSGMITLLGMGLRRRLG